MESSIRWGVIGAGTVIESVHHTALLSSVPLIRSGINGMSGLCKTAAPGPLFRCGVSEKNTDPCKQMRVFPWFQAT